MHVDSHLDNLYINIFHTQNFVDGIWWQKVHENRDCVKEALTQVSSASSKQ